MFYKFVVFLLSSKLSGKFFIFKSSLFFVFVTYKEFLWFCFALICLDVISFYFLALKFCIFCKISPLFWKIHNHYFFNCCFFPTVSLLFLQDFINLYYIFSVYIYVSHPLFHFPSIYHFLLHSRSFFVSQLTNSPSECNLLLTPFI